MYKLAENVTEDVLKENGFRLVFDKDIKAIKTLNVGSVFIENNRNVLCWSEADIQDLIAKGMVVVCNQ